MDKQIEKVIAEVIKEFGEGQATPAIRAAVQRVIEIAAQKTEDCLFNHRAGYVARDVTEMLRSLASDGAAK